MKKFFTIIILISIIGAISYLYINNENSKEKMSVNLAESFFAQKNIWENLDLMPEGGIAGIYKTGYTFFDIDFDGEKELAVQLGGGTLLNCITNFYEYEGGAIKLKDIFDEGYSISVDDLRKFKLNEEEMFINKYRLKIEHTKYITCYDKIFKGSEGIEVDNLFSIEESYNENGEATYTYFINGEKVDSLSYYDEFNNYFDILKEEMLVINFISSEDWKQMNDNEKKLALEKAYSNDDYEYVLEIKNEIISKKDLENAKTYDITLSKEIYGDELTEYKEITKVNDVTAKVITDEESFVYIIPTPDFLDNQIFYFKDGKKVAYVEEFVGIGGEAEYYLKNGELVFINKEGIEESMIFNPVDINEVLVRANTVYSKYIK